MAELCEPSGSGVQVNKRDYYELLGVDRRADDAALKSAYRKLALQFHPDRNPDDPVAEERFKEVSEAYAVLSDAEKRSRYDRFGHAAMGGAAGGQPGADFGDLGNFGDLFNDLFGDIFGGGGRQSGSRRGRGQRGADLRYNLQIDLEDVLNGCEPSLKIPKMKRCETCSGSGAAEGSRPARCGRCEGTGQLFFQQGFFRVNRVCDACGGAGEVVRDHCPGCRGAGRIEGQQTIEVKVPAGVDDGARLRLTGEGEAGIAGGPSGDLYVVLTVRTHPLFERDGTDIHVEVPIQFVQAALGSELQVSTLDGKVNLKFPEGTQSGKMLRLKGKGLPPLRPRMESSQLERLRGDFFVRIFVEVPSKLNAKQRRLLEDFAAEIGAEVSPATRGFMDKFREFFD